ncbi:hypothetical protein DL763_008437 [Monosporascus cannonballus]|nr:hypothetical protein DL763_008437 [Monosporascus cannonballus]
MVWAMMWLRDGEAGTSSLILVEGDPDFPGGGATSKSYCNVLSKGLLPLYEAGDTFMQDNAPIHKSRETMAWLRRHGIKVLEWPPHSPDLNPIEHVWRRLKQLIYEVEPGFHHLRKNKVDFEYAKEVILEAWSRVKPDFLTRLLETLPNRIEACLDYLDVGDSVTKLSVQKAHIDFAIDMLRIEFFDEGPPGRPLDLACKQVFLLSNEEVAFVTNQCGVLEKESERTLPGFAVWAARFAASLAYSLKTKATGPAKEVIGPESRFEEKSWDRFQKQPAGGPNEVSTHGSRREDSAAEESQEEKVSLNRQPLQVLYPGPDDLNKVKIDIVAVHGLGSNVDWTWIWKDRTKHVHWLRDPDMLPAALPNARIMVYSYESRWHTKAPKTRLELCGEELMEDLHNFRTKTRDRPVVFIGHSLGGLVVLHCLLFADRTEKFKYLPARTVGFVALGTPFRGTKMQTLAEKAAWLMAPADKVHAFSKLREMLSIPTECFIERYDSDYGKKIMLPGMVKGMVVEEESAHVPGWGRTFLYTDHFGLNKFSGPNNQSFLSVTAKLQDIYANTENLLERRNTITRNRHFLVPFGRNENFVGRDSILEQLLDRIPPGVNKDDCQRTAVKGLGGIGKTQVTLKAAYRVRDQHPACSVFWVPAVDAISFEKTYCEIGKALGVKGLNNDKADVKSFVKVIFNNKSVGN